MNHIFGTNRLSQMYYHSPVSTLFLDTILAVAFSAFALLGANNLENRAPIAASGLRYVPVVFSLLWVFKHCFPSFKRTQNHQPRGFFPNLGFLSNIFRKTGTVHTVAVDRFPPVYRYPAQPHHGSVSGNAAGHGPHLGQNYQQAGGFSNIQHMPVQSGAGHVNPPVPVFRNPAGHGSGTGAVVQRRFSNTQEEPAEPVTRHVIHPVLVDRNPPVEGRGTGAVLQGRFPNIQHVPAQSVPVLVHSVPVDRNPPGHGRGTGAVVQGRFPIIQHVPAQSVPVLVHSVPVDRNPPGHGSGIGAVVQGRFPNIQHVPAQSGPGHVHLVPVDRNPPGHGRGTGAVVQGAVQNPSGHGPS